MIFFTIIWPLSISQRTILIAILHFVDQAIAGFTEALNGLNKELIKNSLLNAQHQIILDTT